MRAPLVALLLLASPLCAQPVPLGNIEFAEIAAPPMPEAPVVLLGAGSGTNNFEGWDITDRTPIHRRLAFRRDGTVLVVDVGACEEVMLPCVSPMIGADLHTILVHRFDGLGVHGSDGWYGRTKAGVTWSDDGEPVALSDFATSLVADLPQYSVSINARTLREGEFSVKMLGPGPEPETLRIIEFWHTWERAGTASQLAEAQRARAAAILGSHDALDWLMAAPSAWLIAPPERLDELGAVLAVLGREEWAALHARLIGQAVDPESKARALSLLTHRERDLSDFEDELWALWPVFLTEHPTWSIDTRARFLEYTAMRGAESATVAAMAKRELETATYTDEESRKRLMRAACIALRSMGDPEAEAIEAAYRPPFRWPVAE